jgi:hypothetical protein
MKDEVEYERIAEVLGRGEADVIKGMLEAEGIDAQLVEESVSQSSFAVPFANVQIFVPSAQAQQARDLVRPFAAVIEPDDDEEERGSERGGA